MPRSQWMLVLALALMCGVAAGVFVYFIAAAPDVEPRPSPVQPVRVANPSQPSVVSLPTQSAGAAEASPAMPAMQAAALSTKMKPETEMTATQPQTPRSAASLAQRVRHARRQCHEMGERMCRCFPQTCTQQRDAHRNADRSVVESARNLERMPAALNQLLQQLEQSCRESYAAVRRSMPQCF